MTETTLRNIAIATPCIDEEELAAIREPLMSGWLTQGPKVAAFEKAFAVQHQIEHALAVTSCTTALHLGLAALGVGPGDEVIVPAFTWVATANVVLYCGATPVFCDVDTDTFTLNIADAARRVTERTKAIIPVHLFGLCVDIPALRAALPAHISILEDAACAAGAHDRQAYAGTHGDAAAFSFHPRKSITCGEGGMLIMHDRELFLRAEKMRNHGAEISEEVRHHGPKPYNLPDFRLLGFNYRMTDLQGAVGLVQLGKLQRFIEERQSWATYYTEACRDLPWLQPQALLPTTTQHAWQAYVCIVDPAQAPLPRNAMMARLKERGIATRPGTHAVHLLHLYRDKYHLQPEDFPGAFACDQQTMAIPLHNKMTQDDYDYIIEALHDII